MLYTPFEPGRIQSRPRCTFATVLQHERRFTRRRGDAENELAEH